MHEVWTYFKEFQLVVRLGPCFLQFCFMYGTLDGWWLHELASGTYGQAGLVHWPGWARAPH